MDKIMRRKFIIYGAVGTTAGFAGCTSRSDGSGTNSEQETPSPTLSAPNTRDQTSTDQTTEYNTEVRSDYWFYNKTDSEVEIDMTVFDQNSGKKVLQHSYRLPSLSGSGEIVQDSIKRLRGSSYKYRFTTNTGSEKKYFTPHLQPRNFELGYMRKTLNSAT